MSIFTFFSGKQKDESLDVLGRYPEHMQVRALPERRYLKTSRILTLCIFLNMAVMLLITGFFTYYADRIDISIANRQNFHVYSIDSSRQVLIPLEKSRKRMSGMELYVESLVRKYIYTRHSIVWENHVMQLRWGLGGPISVFSEGREVYSPFQIWAAAALEESRKKGFVREVHLYELKRVRSNLWEAVFDTFDMPIPDLYNPVCSCSDNSKECIQCKKNHTSRQMRYRAFIRTAFVDTKEKSKAWLMINPLGLQIMAYNLLYMPVNDQEYYWKIPSDLKPEL